jgi:hypothetical protein
MSHTLPATARDLRAGDNPCRPPRQLVDPPSSLGRLAPFRPETALPEANSFPCGCQQFCCIPSASLGSFGTCLLFVADIVPRRPYRERKFSRMGGLGSLRQTKFDPAKAAQYPQTVARKSAIRLRPRLCSRGPRRPAARPTSDRLANVRSREAWWADGSNT